MHGALPYGDVMHRGLPGSDSTTSRVGRVTLTFEGKATVREPGLMLEVREAPSLPAILSQLVTDIAMPKQPSQRTAQLGRPSDPRGVCSAQLHIHPSAGRYVYSVPSSGGVRPITANMAIDYVLSQRIAEARQQTRRALPSRAPPTSLLDTIPDSLSNSPPSSGSTWRQSKPVCAALGTALGTSLSYYPPSCPPAAYSPAKRQPPTSLLLPKLSPREARPWWMAKGT